MSRKPLPTTNTDRAGETGNQFINMISLDATPKPLATVDIIKATNNDLLLQQVIKSLQSGSWNKSKPLEPYHRVRDSLSSTAT